MNTANCSSAMFNGGCSTSSGSIPSSSPPRRRISEREQQRRRQLAECRAEVASAREHKSLVSYQIDELTALGDSIGRFEELTATYKRLTRARELIETVGGATNEIDEELIARTSPAGRPARRHRRPPPEPAHSRRSGERRPYTPRRDPGRTAPLPLASFPEDDRELAEVDAELAALHDVSRKHRVPARDLGTHLARLEEELASLTVNERQLADLETRAEKAQTKFLAAAQSLSKARRTAAATFSKSITARFAELGLADASIDVEFQDAESAAGLESVEFKVTTNPKYPAGGLAEIASGGELARISLAIEVVAAERSRLPCLILDEADIGVGGVAADVLGRMLKRLSKNTQVIAITHAPQLAALGDAHLKVEKTSAQDTVIRVLTAGRAP